MSEIITAKENSIYTITLNRPEKRNALNDALINDLKTTLREVDKDETLRAIVIKGAGKDFCSGADLSALRKISESNVMENHDDADNLRKLFSMIRRVKIPSSPLFTVELWRAAVVWRRLAILFWRRNRRVSVILK